MIDVLLVLLIVFMVHVPSQRKMMAAQLPPEEARRATGTGIVLEVGPRGRYAINTRPVPAGALGAELRRIYAGRPDRRLVVRGSGRASVQEVVTAMDVARGAGVRVIGLDTRRDEPAAPRAR
jgi:biopolymer transport protein ExbD